MFQQIYDTYWNRMFALVARKVKDRDDVFDIMQNIFFHLWLYRHSLNQQNSESVIIKTCVQEISNYYTSLNRLPFTSEISTIQLADDSTEQLHAQADKEKELELLKLNIDQLPPTRRKIFTMNKCEGITQEKIASDLNLSPKAVKKQIEKALIFLRENQKHS
ncbi:sigma-70 family RNA polymerase sigma factor [Chryseobacterium camelliae]|uniref:sigma-70 family RNA polymerase sigma factor n=1 Tax=Chryseobacterium camelliae TaxID=1265445 RepID=UPI001AEAD086|nr:sigma-70 family RNA polymerase sigma factor [Chryseobacterium camelliae]MDR6513711.1 RNA polymerase sigma-70 factor (ECF subfamily) [Chryseobacterium camelliae]